MDVTMIGGHYLLIFRDKNTKCPVICQTAWTTKCCHTQDANGVPTEETLVKHCPLPELSPKEEGRKGGFWPGKNPRACIA